MDEHVKAKLLSVGSVRVDRAPETRASTAGPGAGLKGFFFRSGERRVRLGVNPDSPLHATWEDDEIIIWEDNEVLARGWVEEAGSHCPHQAYITVSERCIYDCKFCPVPLQEGRVKTLGEIQGIVEEAIERTEIRAISLTSGVWQSPQEEIRRVEEIIRSLGDYDLPIGVSVYPTDDSSRRLWEAGAVEVKYNVETTSPRLFREYCPGLDLDYILRSLERAVEVFGRGRVFTNHLIGLGESDEAVERGVRLLAGMGVIPVLRPISQHPLRPNTEVERPEAGRLLDLARMHRRVLDEHGLRADRAETMCLPCTGCDLTPHKDL